MSKKISLFIDYANLWSSNRTIWALIDFAKLVTYLEKRFGWKVNIRQIYFAYPEEWTRWPEYDIHAIHRFWTYLKKELGFRVRKKAIKRIAMRDENWNTLLDAEWKPRILEKGNLDIELVIDAVMTHSMFDEMVLFSGDSDFLSLVNFMQNRWKPVHVFSSERNISTELKFWGKTYTDIATVPEIVMNELRNKQKT